MDTIQTSPAKVTRHLFIGEWQYSVTYEAPANPAATGNDANNANAANGEAPTSEALASLMADVGPLRHRVTLPPGVWCYDAIVDALVTAEYPSARMQAVINNYLAAPDDPAIHAEFAAMQAWRTEAKRLAREALATTPDGE